MSSCPKECGPQGDVLPTRRTEEAADLSPRAHYSCLKKPDSEEEVVATATSRKSSEQKVAVNENTPCEEAGGENTKPDEEEGEVEEDKAAEEDGKQKRKEVEHSSLFNIADTTSDRRMKITSDALISYIRSLKLSPNKPPRGEALQQATSQELYDDDDADS